MKVVLTWFASEDEVARIRDALPTGTEVFVPAERPHLSRLEVRFDDIAGAIEDADAIMGWVAPPGTFERARRLRALVWCHSGCDELDFSALKARGVRVANVRGANAVSVAEHAMALMLGIAKRLVVKHKAVTEARSEPLGDERPESVGVVLEGKTLAVIGLGEIGRRIARHAGAFRMRVLGIRRHPGRSQEHVDEIHGPDALHHVLAQADFVVLATPITRETEGFIDEAAIGAMKPGAFLVNPARGNLVDERALHAALTDGRLAGYAADVWWTYENALPATYHFPIPSRTGIQNLPNVLATGSSAGVAIPGVIERVIAMGTESLAAFCRGEPMPRTIDLDLGY